MDDFISKVREETDIVSVVSSYVPLKHRGGRFWGCCPFHHEKTPSFSVVPDKGFFYCFGCHAGGDVFKFLTMIENVSFFDAVKLQAEKLGIPVPERPLTEEEKKRRQEADEMRHVMELARNFFHNCLTKTSYGKPGLGYWDRRGISENIIEEFSLGFAPDAWDKLSKAFTKRGIKRELLEACGLSMQRKQGDGLYDRFRNRVMIPITDERGRIVGFGGRVLGDGHPKYLNSPETLIFNKRRLLFGLDKSHRDISNSGVAILVEGYMDAISLYAAGIHNVAASLGTAFTLEQGKKLKRYASKICFCYDSDEPGQKATVRALSIAAGLSVRLAVIKVPDGKDPDEFIRKHGADEFRKLVIHAVPAADFRIRYVIEHSELATLEGRVDALGRMMPILKDINNAVERDEYIKSIAKRLKFDEGSVKAELLRHTGEEPEQAEPTRRINHAQRPPSVRVADDKEAHAFRTIVRAASEDPGTLVYLFSVVPLEEFKDPVQHEILSFMQDGRSDYEELSQEANAEYSCAMNEGFAGDDMMKDYEGSIFILKKIHLERLFSEHSRKADDMARIKDEGYQKELNEVQRLQREMQKLQARMDNL